MNNDTKRKAFEKYAVRTICCQSDLERKELTGYASLELNYLWRGWSARAEQDKVNAELLAALKLALTRIEDDWHQIDSEWGPIMRKFGGLEGAISAEHHSVETIVTIREAIANAEKAR